MFSVLDKKGNTVLIHHDRGYCDHYARQIKGAVRRYAADVKRNPEGYFGEEEDSVATRVARFSQYRGTPSYIWARETIQNSVDNKATRIIFSVLDITEGPLKGCSIARISDNGTGMSWETLRDKFLTMGGTDKTEADMGGFGEAKKVVLLGWKAWRVITKRKGAKTATMAEAINGGRKYFYQEIEPPEEIAESGTIVEVLCWDIDKYKIYLHHAMNFVQYCNLPSITFFFASGRYVNGLHVDGLPGSFKYEPESETAITRQILKSVDQKSTLAFLSTAERNYKAQYTLGPAKATFQTADGDDAAKLYYRRHKGKESDSGCFIFYRVDGLLLWYDGLPSKVKGNIVIEFNRKYNKRVLSNNRDSIKDGTLRSSIEQWQQELVIDPTTKLRGFSKTRTICHAGSLGALVAPIKPAAAKAAAAIAHIRSGGYSKAQANKAIDDIIDTAVQAAVTLVKSDPSQSPIAMTTDIAREFIKFEAKSGVDNDPNGVQEAIQRAVMIPEYLTHVDDDLFEEGYEIPQKFLANKLTKDVKTLLTVWAEMCRVVFMLRGTNLRFGVGFVFSDSCGGLYVPRTFLPSGGDWNIESHGFVLLNPFTRGEDGKKRLRDVTNDVELRTIWATCVHECTHMIDGISYHDEAYSGALTANIAHTAAVYGLIQDIVRICLANNEMSKDRFKESLDVEAYLDPSIKRLRTPRERLLEKYIKELAVELAHSGRPLPPPDKWRLELPDSLLQEAEAVRAADKTHTKATAGIDRIRVKQLERKLAALQEEKKPRKKIDVRKIVKRY